MKNILVMGATGMAGHMITLYLTEQKYNVFCYSRNKINLSNNINGDIHDLKTIEYILETSNPDYVINCLGILNKSCDNDIREAIYINSLFPHILEDYSIKYNYKLIHLSTDCVFSGEKGSYNENDYHDGKSIYDKTKSLGEVVKNHSLTFRNSIIGPELKKQGIGLFNWFMNQSNSINGYNNALWNGVTTLELAKAISYIIDNDILLEGVYQLTSPTYINKFDLCSLFNKYFKNNSIIIKKHPDIAINKVLVNNRKDFPFKTNDYDIQIREMKEWIESHRDIYDY